MKYLILVLTLATGETPRIPMPAWECRAIQAEHEHANSIGGYTERDDGVRVVGMECVTPLLVDMLQEGSVGPCEEGEV